MTAILGAILAGGRARRFGSDKAVAMYAGRTLLDHVIAALQLQTTAVVVCGRRSADFTAAAVAAIPDRPAPDLGPLGGLNAALHHARSHGFNQVLSAGCDTPLLPGDLTAHLAGPGPAFVRDMPIIGLWPVALAGDLDRHLATAGDRSMQRWVRSVGARVVELAEATPNINTPADLADLISTSP